MIKGTENAASVHIRYLLPVLIVITCTAALYFLSVRLISLVQYQKAVNRIRTGDYREAVSILSRDTRHLTNHAAAWKALGQAHQLMTRQQSISEAFSHAKLSEAAFREAVRIAPMDAESVFGLAMAIEQLEQLEVYVHPGSPSTQYHALAYFKEAIRLRPNNTRYRYALVKYLYRHSADQQLLEAITEFTSIDPTVYHRLKTERFWSEAAREAAKSGVTRAIRKRIDPGNSHMILSQLYEEGKEYQSAIDSCRNALAYMKDDSRPEVFDQLGRLYLENHRKDEARTAFIRGISLSRNRENDLKNLYHLYKRKGAAEHFIDLINSAKNRFPLSGRTDLLLANALSDIKRYPEAIAVLKHHNKKAPDPEAFYAMARIFEKQQDWDGMELAIQKATVYDPKNFQYHFIFSQVLKRLKKYETAETAAGKAIATASPPSAALYNHRANIRWEMKRYRGAAEDWEAASRLDSKNAALHAWAAEAYVKTGDIDRAAEHYRKALDVDPDNMIQ